MCQFFRGIQTKAGIIFDADSDSHEFLIKNYKLNDRTREPDFVRLELIPTAEPWNKDPSKWVLHVDQDTLPSWFSEEFARQEMWTALQLVWKEAFIINEEVEELKDRSVRFIVKSHIKKMTGKSWALEVFNSTIDEMRDSSGIGTFDGFSRVGVMKGKSSIQEMGDYSHVEVMEGTSSIKTMQGFSSVGVVKGKSCIHEMCAHSHIDAMEGKSKVKMLKHFSSIRVMKESSRVKEMCQYSRVDTMEGNSIVFEIRDKAKVGE